MGIECSEPKPDVRRNPEDSLLAPGREDLSLWPPIGQLAFERITTMSEKQLDEAFKERHGLDEIFNVTDGHVKPYQKDSQSGRRVEIKRIALARLEGYQLRHGSEIEEWTGPVRPSTVGHTDSLRQLLQNVLNDACRRRIADVHKFVAREAALYAPTQEVREILNKIQPLLSSQGFEAMSPDKILRVTQLPPHVPESKTNIFDVKTALRVFLLKLQGSNNAECAKAVGVKIESLENLDTYRFSDAAKEVIQEVRRRQRTAPV